MYFYNKTIYIDVLVIHDNIPTKPLWVAHLLLAVEGPG